MSRMSEYTIWIEDILAREHWDTDNEEVQDCLYKNQDKFFSMYLKPYNDAEVADTFKALWNIYIKEGI